ncbi:MAG TPA: hypothetical protein VGI82_02295, partial [Chitinophagaceae bacterium]
MDDRKDENREKCHKMLPRFNLSLEWLVLNEKYMLSFSITGTYTDLYELTMGETFFLEGRKDDRACFDYFFRNVPSRGGYVVFAGLGDVFDILEDLHFTDQDLDYLKELKFHPEFINYLKNFKF